MELPYDKGFLATKLSRRELNTVTALGLGALAVEWGKLQPILANLEQWGVWVGQVVFVDQLAEVMSDDRFLKLDKSKQMNILGMAACDSFSVDDVEKAKVATDLAYAVDALLDDGLTRPNGVSDKWMDLRSGYVRVRKEAELRCDSETLKRLDAATLVMIGMDINNRQFEMGKENYIDVARYKVATCAGFAMYWLAGGREMGNIVGEIEKSVEGKNPMEVIDTYARSENVQAFRDWGRDVTEVVLGQLPGNAYEVGSYLEADRRFLTGVGLITMAQVVGDMNNYTAGHRGVQMSFRYGAKDFDESALNKINNWAKTLVSESRIIPAVAVDGIVELYEGRLFRSHNQG